MGRANWAVGFIVGHHIAGTGLEELQEGGAGREKGTFEHFQTKAAGGEGEGDGDAEADFACCSRRRG